MNVRRHLMLVGFFVALAAGCSEPDTDTSVHADSMDVGSTPFPTDTETETETDTDTDTTSAHADSMDVGSTPSPTDTETETNTGTDTGPAHKLHIELDYSRDKKGFFKDPVRRNALQAAADTWSNLLADDFATVPAGTTIKVFNPDTPGTTGDKFATATPIDDLRIYVGCSDTGTKLAKAYTSYTWKGSTSLGKALSERYLGKDFQPWVAAISFHCKQDWFFDTTPATADDIPKGSSDFISTAHHEIGHCLGAIGAKAAQDLVDKSKAIFTGKAAAKAFGGPIPLQSDGRHIKNGTKSGGQEVLMDPSSTKGKRKVPTAVDLGILVDIGYELR